MVATKMRADSTGSLVGVDNDANVLRGFVVAQMGPFKTKRGAFNFNSLKCIVRLANSAPGGLRSNLDHPEQGKSRRLGGHLGRARNFRIDGDKVRADLHFDPVANAVPIGGGRPHAEFVKSLATTDAHAIGASLVLSSTQTLDRDSAGRPRRDADGSLALPIWNPTALAAVDLVAEPDASVCGLLGISSRDLFEDALDVNEYAIRVRHRRRQRLIDEGNQSRITASEDELFRLRWRNKLRHLAGISRPQAEADAEPVTGSGESAYGFCPICGAPGASRERRPRGNDRCAAGHVYPSSDACDEAPQPT